MEVDTDPVVGIEAAVGAVQETGLEQGDTGVEGEDTEAEGVGIEVEGEDTGLVESMGIALQVAWAAEEDIDLALEEDIWAAAA